LAFIPVSIDYEKIVEGSSYSQELLGGEKKPEDVRALINAPRVLLKRYGRIHLTFDEPVLLKAFMESRGLNDPGMLTEEQKRGLVRALGNRIMWGIARVSTVTPHALVSAALLSHSGRGISASAVAIRIQGLRRMCAEDGSPLSGGLLEAPTDPAVPGPVREALLGFINDGLVRVDQAKGETMYLPVDERRVQLAYYKNTLMNVAAPRALVACAVVRGADPAEAAVRSRALTLSRLFKYEFIYRVGAPFEVIFAETVDRLVAAGLLERRQGQLVPAAGEPAALLEFLAALLRDYLESYLLAALTLEDLARGGPMDRKSFVKGSLETGRLEFLTGRLSAVEALSRTNLENALAYFLDQDILSDKERKLTLGAAATMLEQREALRTELRGFIGR
jgi:glycerol-3-phosphate O-acyltransferase